MFITENAKTKISNLIKEAEVRSLRKEGLTLREISEKTGINISTVKDINCGRMYTKPFEEVPRIKSSTGPRLITLDKP